jgi:hypothetical protein
MNKNTENWKLISTSDDKIFENSNHVRRCRESQQRVRQETSPYADHPRYPYIFILLYIIVLPATRARFAALLRSATNTEKYVRSARVVDSGALP